MVRNKNACGLCKPHKKWKKNNTKEKSQFKKLITKELYDHKGHELKRKLA